MWPFSQNFGPSDEFLRDEKAKATAADDSRTVEERMQELLMQPKFAPILLMLAREIDALKETERRRNLNHYDARKQ